MPGLSFSTVLQLELSFSSHPKQSLSTLTHVVANQSPPSRVTLHPKVGEIFSWGTLKKYGIRIKSAHDTGIGRTSAAMQFKPSKSLFHRVYLNMIRRAQLCIDPAGNHLQHLLSRHILSAFGYCINFCIYVMLRTQATFSWPILYIKALLSYSLKKAS